MSKWTSLIVPTVSVDVKQHWTNNMPQTCLGGASVCSSDSDRPSQFSQYRLNDHISLTQSFSLSESWTFLPSDVAWCPRVSADILGRDKPLRQCVRKAYCFTSTETMTKAARRRHLLLSLMDWTGRKAQDRATSTQFTQLLISGSWTLSPWTYIGPWLSPATQWLIQVATSQFSAAGVPNPRLKPFCGRQFSHNTGLEEKLKKKNKTKRKKPYRG